MKPSARRRVERELQVIIADNGDNCTVCGKAFLHNSKTVGGVTLAGAIVLVGECCARKISEIVVSGLYLDHPYDFAGVPGESSTCEPISGVDLEKHIKDLQCVFADVDNLVAEALRDAGLPTNRASVSVLENAWKTEDAAWFKANPKRSHRLRAMFTGEEPTLFNPSAGIPDLPQRHEFQVLVRQVKPGTRVRVLFCRNAEVPIPDVEAAIHAIFDIVTAERDRQGFISVKEVAALAKKYIIEPHGTKPS
jgi:hypothetical protein